MTELGWLSGIYQEFLRDFTVRKKAAAWTLPVQVWVWPFANTLSRRMEFNMAGFEKKFKRIARTLELKDETGGAVVKYLFDLNSKINIPHGLGAIGVKQEHIETLADLAIADFAHPNNPKPVSREDFRNLYSKAL